MYVVLFCQAEDGIRYLVRSRGLGDVYKRQDDSLSYKLQHFLHKPVAYFIVPLFALANTGIRLQPGFYNEFFSKNSLGIIAGLVIGKPIGILLFAWIAVKTKLSELPGMLNWKYITGAGLLAGIGFTMSIFITPVSYTHLTLPTSDLV